jgi:tRNA-2-methylthio-N6-dimethylallyladenosine synthase
VPYTRGHEVSRNLEDVLAEVTSLAAQGVREVTLLGQNVNGYRGRRPDGRRTDLATLIRDVAAVEGIERIRFTTSHPREFGESLVQAYADVPKLAGHLHLPVQSGSDRILALMKRRYTVADYLAKVQRVREVRPDISISTDFIVGFPGETDEDFAATMDLIAAVGFDQSFSFIYSPRPGTPAADLPDDTPDAEKHRRLEILQARIDAQAQERSRRLVGSRQRILVERPARRGDGLIAGRTECNRWLNFEGPRRLIGSFADVRVTEALANSLRGALEAETAPAGPNTGSAA